MSDLDDGFPKRSWRPLEIDINLPNDNPEWWVKVIEMLQQNWALPVLSQDGIQVLFVGDTSGVFDRMRFPNIEQARVALKWNGFSDYGADHELQRFLLPPKLPLHEGRHPNGPIYSSGRYWRTNK